MLHVIPPPPHFPFVPSPNTSTCIASDVHIILHLHTYLHPCLLGTGCTRNACMLPACELMLFTAPASSLLPAPCCSVVLW